MSACHFRDAEHFRRWREAELDARMAEIAKFPKMIRSKATPKFARTTFKAARQWVTIEATK